MYPYMVVSFSVRGAWLGRENSKTKIQNGDFLSPPKTTRFAVLTRAVGKACDAFGSSQQQVYAFPGQEDYDRLRPLSYQNTNVVLICYDVMNPTSFDNVLIKWSHEVNHFCRGIPIVLVGCKTDLRKDKEHLRKLRSAEQEPITYRQGEEACRQMNADVYLECSAKFRENIEAVFKETASIALSAMKKAKRQTKSRPCAIL
ncbi:rho-related GTP-binding protein RhoF isoform X2 [Elgaria multicarinata webbii]|uniref:rho-related GTP-binding protein RhoF isoform X2 n=1 Tax=Elgaria multicarinata webbii TaxID=159646 RepID=UPI002FCD16A0